MQKLLYYSSIILSLLLFYSCQKTNVEQLHLFNYDFDSTSAADYTNKLSYKEQVVFFNKIIDSNKQNIDVIDQWIANNILKIGEQISVVETQTLYALLAAAEKMNYLKSAQALAGLVYAKSTTKTFLPIVSLAANTYINKYFLLNQADSIDKHLQIMRDYLPYDTNQIREVSYYFVLGNFLALKGKYFEAVVNYNNALERLAETDTANQVEVYQSMAIMYLKMDYFDKAKSYLDKVTSLIGESYFNENNLLSFAVIKSKTGDMEGAERILEKALLLNEKQNNPVARAQILANFGNLKRKQKKFSEGLQLMQASDSICMDLGLEIGVLINQINRAELFFDQHAFNQAKQTLLNAQPLVNAYDNPKFNKEFYALMYKINDSLGNTTDANHYFRLYIQHKEQFIGDLPRSVIAEWELDKETHQFTQKNNALTLKVQQQIKHKYQILFILSIILLVFILFYFIRNKRYVINKEKLKFENQKISYELELKSKELLADSLKNLTIQQLKEELKEVLKTALNDLPVKYHSNFKELNKKLHIGASKFYLEEFETRFTQVYDEFYVKLKRLAPNLTPNELRICALMRLNISTKEIAMITNRTIGTVDNTRSAIRKKLKIEDHVNLQELLIAL